MDCTFEELINLYTLSKAYVSVRELEEAGLVKEFCDRVEKIAPTQSGYLNHWEMFDSFKSDNDRVEKIAPTQSGYLNHWKMFDSFKSDNYYFGLVKVRHGAMTETFCSGTTSVPSDIMIVHLIDDVPPIDMEGLLAE